MKQLGFYKLDGLQNWTCVHSHGTHWPSGISAERNSSYLQWFNQQKQAHISYEAKIARDLLVAIVTFVTIGTFAAIGTFVAIGS